MELTISLNRVSFLPPPVRNNIFYEIETLSTGLYNIGLGAQSTAVQEGAGPRFGEEPLKTTENSGLGPLFAPSFEKVWIHPRSTLRKNYRSIRIRILLSNRGPTRGKVITVIHKQ
jgi:hypothetical protein